MSAISNAIWIIVYGGIGYFCAETMIQQMAVLSDNSGWVVGILGAIGLLYWFFIKRKEIKSNGNILTGH